LELKREKAQLDADLRQNLAQIGEMHKEVEEKSDELAEKANQINALLVQLIESIRFLN
jgi:ABC-type transporter Mla subunit MlaD